jgi:hypothetical protein
VPTKLFLSNSRFPVVCLHSCYLTMGLYATISLGLNLVRRYIGLEFRVLAYGDFWRFNFVKEENIREAHRLYKYKYK